MITAASIRLQAAYTLLTGDPVRSNEVAAIAGLRQMFVFTGIIFSVSTVTAILNRSADPGIAQARILRVVAGVLLAVMVPLVSRVPEHKGSW
jgi:hypothetical protein